MVEITYHKEGDFFVSDLYLEKKDYIIRKYRYLRLEYLKSYQKAEYIIMFLNKTLRKHRVELLMNEMLKKNHIDENLKNTDSLK